MIVILSTPIQPGFSREARRRRLAGHLFQDKWKDQGRGFVILPHWPPNCLGQMLTLRDFSQFRHPKPLDQTYLGVPDVWDTVI